MKRIEPIFLLVVVIYSFACSKDVQSSKPGLVSPKGAQGRASFESNVYPYLIKNCAPCHKQVPPKIASNDVDISYQAATPLINWNQIESSILIRKAKDRHCGSACETDGNELIRLIQKWNSAELNK